MLEKEFFFEILSEGAVGSGHDTMSGSQYNTSHDKHSRGTLKTKGKANNHLTQKSGWRYGKCKKYIETT